MTVNSVDTPEPMNGASLSHDGAKVIVASAVVGIATTAVQEPGTDSTPRARQVAEKNQESAMVGICFDDVVSGQFDVDDESPDAPALKRVLAPQAETPKLHKVLAQAGMGSRLEMEQLIMEGRITVNNQWQADPFSY